MKPSRIALFIISVSLRRALLHFFYPLPLEGERPKGKGVGRRRNRAKPISGATRHLLPKEGGRNQSKCSALYTSSLKAGYSYSLFMNLHNLILRLNQRFLNTRRFSPLRMTKCAVPLPPSPLNLQNPLPPLLQTIKGQHAPGANSEPLLPIKKAM